MIGRGRREEKEKGREGEGDEGEDKGRKGQAPKYFGLEPALAVRGLPAGGLPSPELF